MSFRYRKMLLLMKLTTVLLIATCLQVSAKGIAQISIREKNVSLDKVFKQIRQQSGYDLLCSAEVIKQSGTVTVNLQNATIEEAIRACLKDKPLNYKILDNTVVISLKEEKKSQQITEGLNPWLEVPAPLPPVVHGRITNEKGEPAAGVSISLKGGKVIGVTNENGEFTLTNVPDNATLVFSAVTIETFETKLNGRSELALAAKIKVSELQEVIINKGYYNEKQKMSAGSVSRVTAKEIDNQPINNPLLALQGRVPGLVITQTNGLPGSGVSVRLQGQNSILSGSDPLYVVDGMPYTSQLLPTGLGAPLDNSGGALIRGFNSPSGNPLSFINPQDIESIEILKDADATAIYGSRAANGAILITTKKGQSGQTKVNATFQNGWGRVTRKLRVLNTTEYLQMRREAKLNDNATITSTDYDINGLWDTAHSTDWQKVMLGNTAHYMDVQSSVTGGGDNLNYLVGAGYHRETTVIPGDYSDQKGSVHFNIGSKSKNQNFIFQFSGNFLFDHNNLSSNDPTGNAIRLAPNAPNPFNSDGSFNWALTSSGTSSWNNPFAALSKNYINNTTNLISNVIISYELVKGLELVTNLGYNSLQTKEYTPNPLSAVRPEFKPTSTRSSIFVDNSIRSWIVEPQVKYSTEFKRHKISGLIGSSLQQTISAGQQVGGIGYNSDLVMMDIKSATSLQVLSSLQTNYKYNAVFGRLNYSYDNKYIVNLTGRRDGSSRFGSANQLHDFGAVGVAWIFSEESGLNKKFPFLNFGKLRGSIGITGNDQIGDYQFMNLYSSIGGVSNAYQGVTGILPNSLPNAFLQWETTRKLQAGVDLAFLDDKIALTVNYVNNRSSNQLLPYTLPRFVGFATITDNFPATIQNTAWEFSIVTKNIRTQKISWNSSFNLTIPKNSLIDFPNLSTSAYAGSLIIGQPLSILKVYDFKAVDPSTGIFQFINSVGNVVSNPSFPNDMTKLVNLNPVFYGGFQNQVSYRGFTLDFLIQFVKQNAQSYAYNSFVGAGEFNSGFGNQPVTVMARWKSPGDLTNVQRFSQGSSIRNGVNNFRSSNAGYEDASFIRFKNISLSWTVPAAWAAKAKINMTQVFLHAQNLITITKYSGLDPESRSVTSLPLLAMITVGLKASF